MIDLVTLSDEDILEMCARPSVELSLVKLRIKLAYGNIISHSGDGLNLEQATRSLHFYFAGRGFPELAMQALALYDRTPVPELPKQTRLEI